ncbi:MAG: purine-binding chemotaxis protein CheW [Telmatospirillum sp.]|nr:purine-binding chemotaxis protein CheW [Telmatospirillum sp.]
MAEASGELSLDRILADREKRNGTVVSVDEPEVKLVVVALGEEWFAVPGDLVREVLPDCPVFYLPGCPASMDGVINVRGDIETVIDLRGLLGIAPPADRGRRILLCEAGGMRSGVRVDAVEEVMDVPQSRIQAPPQTVPESRRAVVTGIMSYRDRVVTVLGLGRMFEAYRAGLG